MFGRSKPTKPAKANNAALDMGIDMDPSLMNMDMDMGDVEIDDAELQAELLALEGGTPAAASQPKAPKKKTPQKAEQSIDYEKVLHDTGGDVMMGDVTADDFDDADLMAEFAAIGGNPEELKAATKPKPKPPAQRPQPRNTQASAPAPEKGAVAPAPAPPKQVQPTVSAPKDAMATATTTATLNDNGEGEDEQRQALGVANQLSVVKKRQTGYRKGAIAANKASNKPLALACMKIMKNMDPLMEQLQAGITVDLSQLPQPYEEVADDLAEQAAKHASKQNPAPKAPAAPKQTPPAQTNPPPAKPARGNTPAAQSRPMSAGAAENPPAKTKAKAMTSSIQDVQAQAILADCDSSGDIYEELISQVTEQHNRCAALARQLLKQGDKSQAVSFHSLSKAFDADRKRLAVAKQHNHIPQFHREERIIKSERSFPELTPNQMELVILEVKGLPKDLLSHSMSIDFEFPYPSDEPQKGSTNTFKGSADHALNHVERITIGRNKVFGRVVSRPKYLTLTLKYKKFFGVKEVGTAKVSLGPLQNKSEIHEQVEFCVDRKSVGCVVDVRMRIRQPLEGKDTQEEKVMWVFVDSTTPVGSRPITPAAPGSVQSTPAETDKPKTASQKAKSPQPKTPQVEKPAPKTAPPPTTAAVDPYADGDTTGDPTSVAGIISNSVLEWMAEDAQKTQNDCKRSGKPAPDDLEDRIIAINTAMQLLVMQIQSGALDIEDYLQALREAVGKDKGLAIMLKKKGKTQWAVAAMKRVKLMMEELKDSDPNEPDIPAIPYHPPGTSQPTQPTQPTQHTQNKHTAPVPPSTTAPHTGDTAQDTSQRQQQAADTQDQQQQQQQQQHTQHTPSTPQPYVSPNTTRKSSPAPPTKPPQPPQRQPPPPQPQQPQQPPPPPQQQQKQPTQAQANQPPQAKKKKNVDPEGDFEGDPMDVAGHVSNEVLEWEVNNCAKAIAAAKAKGQEPDNDILQKKQTAEVMMQVLIIQIQTEKLSLEDYCAQVKAKIVEEKKLAAKLKAKNKIEWAKAALMRAKIMEKEMEE